MKLNDENLQRQLESIDGVESAEEAALELLVRLNCVVKMYGVDESLVRGVYETKRRLIHYFDLQGKVVEKIPEAEGLQGVVIRAGEKEARLHHKSIPRAGRSSRRNTMLKGEDDLPPAVEQWASDAESMHKALNHIALAIGAFKPAL